MKISDSKPIILLTLKTNRCLGNAEEHSPSTAAGMAILATLLRQQD
jgi:hypothetical protein